MNLIFNTLIPILNFFKNNKHIYCLGFGVIFNSGFLFGQVNSVSNSDSDIKNQISFRHDNDFLVFTDRYYSSGLFLSYGKRLNQGIFKSGHEQLLFSLSQEIYTPSKTNTKNIVEMDRPYAGFMGFTLGWSYTKSRNNLEANFLIGLAGKNSGAGSFHRWYHNALEVPKPPTWAYEIANSFHFNLYGQFSHEWQLAAGDFGVYLAVQPKFALGTKDIYSQPEVITYFGRRNTLSKSSAYHKIGSKNQELFFALRAGYRFVGHNGMLEGNLLGDHSIFMVKPKSIVFCAGFDLQHHSHQNDYWLGYRFNSKETADTKSHKYVILSYARSF